MNKRIVVYSIMLALTSFITWAGGNNDVIAQGQISDVDVLSLLSQRSGLPDTQLKALLSSCDADQQSMYFCAYRDLVRAELKLDQAIAGKKISTPACATELDKNKLKWLEHRNLSCEKSAKAEWNGGSMEPTAKLLCMASETERATQVTERETPCTLLKSSR